MERILIVAAHPDDEVLGCGGTARKLAHEGKQVYTLILGEGITARGEHAHPHLHEEALNLLQDNAREANKAIGVEEVFFGGLPDNRFDTAPLLEIVKVVEEHIARLTPDTIFTHFAGDLNIDHQITNQAVLAATRPQGGCPVREVYAFEVPSSTEWNYPITFSPNTFINCTETMEAKLEAMAAYTSELRDYPHPRSLEALRHQGAYWGNRVGVAYAEPFVQLRRVVL